MKLHLKLLETIDKGQLFERERYLICIQEASTSIDTDLEACYAKRGIDYSGVDHDADYVELYRSKNNSNKLYIGITPFEWGTGIDNLFSTKWHSWNGTKSQKIKADKLPKLVRLDYIYSNDPNRTSNYEATAYVQFRKDIDQSS